MSDSEDQPQMEMDSIPKKEKKEKKTKKSKSKTKEYNIKKIDIDFDTEDTRTLVEQNLKPVKHPLGISFKNVTYSVDVPAPKSNWKHYIPFYPKPTKKRVLLNNISGEVKPGQFLAVMGPTGSGKTTFLTVLSNRIKKGVEGTILANGAPRNSRFKRNIAYVLQDDVLLGRVTVEDTLKLTSRLRLPKNMTTEEKYQKVDDIIQVLNLEKARGTIVGDVFHRGVSGGERKRVNIGLELLPDPSLVLLDEPTSGLDTSTALNLLKILKAMTSIGITVICAIHQPSSQMFELFDLLMLLVDGNPIYFGNADEALSYFAGIGLECEKFYNPADFLMGLILQHEINDQGPKLKAQLIEAYQERASENGLIEGQKTKSYLKADVADIEDDVEVKQPKYPISWFEQVWVLLSRAFINAKGINLEPLQFIQVFGVAVAIGLVWFQLGPNEDRIQDRIGILFFISVFYGAFNPSFQAIFNYPPERAVLQRERAEGSYYFSAYFIAKTIADLPFQVMWVILFIVIPYWMAGLRGEPERFIAAIIILFVGSFSGSSFGLMMTGIFKDVRHAITAATVTLLSMLFLGGFYVDLERIPIWIRWAQYLSFVKFGFDSLLINEFEGRTFTQDPDFDSQWTGTPITGEEILQGFSLLEDVYINVLILFGYGLLFRTFAYLTLKINYKGKG